MNINITQVIKPNVKRSSNELYFQALNYEHLWKEEGNLIDNIFIVTISDQFYNSETKKELINTIQVHFNFKSSEKILHKYQDPKERHKDAIPLIASMTYETHKLLRQDTLKVFKKEEFKNIDLPELSEQLIYNIVYTSLPQMSKDKTPITLVKENWTANYIIALFSIIDKATSDKKFIVEGNKVTLVKKEKDEIFEFSEDIGDLKKRIYNDFLSNRNVKYLHLTSNESDLFRKCSHAAYYFEIEATQVDNKGLRNFFIETHEKFFK